MSRIGLTRSTAPASSPCACDVKAEAARLVAAFRRVEPRFDPTAANAALLNSALAWVWRRDSLNQLGLDYRKGLLLHGPLGVGKSLTLMALRKYMVDVYDRVPAMRGDYRLKAWLATASELANAYAADGQPALMPYAAADVNLVVDELGREPRPAKYYGTEMNVLQFLLQLRYDHRHTSVTHATTNMELSQLAARYGDFVADRAIEMFNFVEVSGTSKRK